MALVNLTPSRALLPGLLVLALNLRASLAGYPPLLETVRAELGTSSTVAGLVQAGAVLMMAVGSFAGSALGVRWGWERALGGAVGIVALGGLVRAVPHVGALLVGSVAVGFGIGAAGVLLTGVVTDRLAERAGAVTGAYVVAMLVGATVASGLAVPLAVTLGGWSFSLAVWAVPAAIAVALWVPVASAAPPRSPGVRQAARPGRRCSSTAG